MAPVFPHVVLDNLFDQQTYETAKNAFPSVDSPIWKKPENEHTRGKFVTKRGPEGIKELLYSHAARSLLRELNSASFLRFLELISGISGLIPDPSLAEAGFHCSGSGGFLDVHADFSHHDETGLERRLNLIYFVNEAWSDKWGGFLGLYDRDLNLENKIKPMGNRAAIFATSDISYHGHPEPMNLPDGVYRRSIAMYYYTIPTGREKTKIVFPNDRAFVHAETAA
jgi:hypothetical protein